jgi:hypothetical protein
MFASAKRRFVVVVLGLAKSHCHVDRMERFPEFAVTAIIHKLRCDLSYSTNRIQGIIDLSASFEMIK